METARSARAKNESGAALTDEERLALSYLDAMGKMQHTTVESRPRHR